MRYFAFGNGAFNNKVVRTDDGVTVETTYVSAVPHSKQTKSWFAPGAPI